MDDVQTAAERELRWRVDAVVAASPLVRKVAAGDQSAAAKLLYGFWPFVDAFPRMIKDRLGDVAGMAAEERLHTYLWSECMYEYEYPFGASNVFCDELLVELRRADERSFVSRLAAVELIAEGLARALVGTGVLERWCGEHLKPNRHLDLDLRMALRDDPNQKEVADEVLAYVHRFAAVASRLDAD